jgi:hypothetical protein
LIFERLAWVANTLHQLHDRHQMSALS